MFFTNMITWLPICSYVPALTFNQVTGINIHVITPIVCLICTFYTCVGGLKAVVWTDSFQSFIMFGSMVLIMIKGTINVGGFGTLWQRNLDGDRLVLPDLTLDPTVRLSILAVIIGGTFHKTQSTAINQIIIQRFMALPTREDCKKCLCLFIFLLIVLMGSCVYVGLILYATYYDCDPVATGLAQQKDQMVPLLVQDLLGVIPGMAGLFVSAVFSASLSSMSTGLNSLSAVILEDFIKPFRTKPLSEKQVHYILRFIVLFFGLAIIGLVFIVEKLGMVLQLSSTLGAVMQGPMLTIFLFGICVPWINSKSMLSGAIIGFLFMAWYFERRFNSSLRLFGSILFVVGEAVWFPIALYVPALTFNQVTGISIHTITPIVCGIVTFYTCVGGLKAVVWTDVVQSGLMYGSILLVIIKGTYDLGGLSVVLQRNNDSGRLDWAEFTFDPTVRMSMLAVIIGGTLLRLQGTSIHQVGVQRFLSLPTSNDVKKSLILCSIGLTILLGSCCYTGMLAYAFYYNCDPTTTGLAQAKDQIIPVYMMKVLEKFPGLAGVFVSGVFSAALSSLSSSLNSLAAVIHEDFMKKFSKHPLSEKQSAWIMRSTVVIVGIVGFCLVFVVEKLGTVMQLSATMQSITQGPLLAIFTIGMCLPWIKAESTITGGVMAFVVMAWICIKAQLAIATGDMVFRTKPVSIDGCDYDFGNITISNVTNFVEDYSEKSIYHISFLWYCPLGFAITIIVSILSSFLYGWNDTSEVDRDLIAAPFHRFMKNPKYKSIIDFVEKLEKPKL